ncbi:MAG: MFS transporter [Nitrospirae bacterium]|nr:MFS transporter [Nitrospirota bacterium]
MTPRQNRLFTGLRKNVLIFGAVSFLNDAASEMIYPLLPVFLTRVLKAGPAALGVIEGIAESTASLLKLVSGYLSDRVRRRKPWVVGGYLLSNTTRPLIGLAATWPAVLILRFFDRVGKGVRTSPRDAMIAESTPPEYQGKAFGFHRAADHAGAVVGPLIATLLLISLAADLRTIFLLSLIPGILTVALLWVGVRETPRPKVSEETRPEPLHPLKAWREIPPTLHRFFLILFLFTLGNSSDAFLLLKAQETGIAVALLPLLWVVLHLVKMAFAMPAGIASDRRGRKGMIVGGWLIYAATYAGFIVADSPWQIWVLFAVYGLHFGLTEGPERALIADLAPAHLRGSIYGLYHLTMGIGMLPASVLFGWVWQTFGAGAAFGMGALLALAAAWGMWRLPVGNRNSSLG